MSLEEIRKSIDRDAKGRADAIDEAAEEEAATIVKDAKAMAADILKSAKADAYKEAERVKGEQVSGAKIEANSIIVAAREAVLERHMPQLLKGVTSELSGKRLGKVVEGAAKQFSKFSTGANMVVRTGKKNAALVKKLGYVTVPGKEDEISIESKDGSLSIDASPQGLSELHSAEARSALASRLWKVKQ